MESIMIPLNAPPSDGREPETVVVVERYPRDHIVWSVVNLLCGNPCCLGLLAFYYSIKSRDRKIVGDMTGAESYGSKANCVNGCVLAIIIILTIITIALTVIYYVSLKSIVRTAYERFY